MLKNTNNLTLVIDSNDNYADQLEVFNIKPEKLHLTKCFDNERFFSCRIENTPVDIITPLFLSNLLNKLTPDAQVSVVISQPIEVMQESDAKQVEANAKLAGFEGVECKSVDVNDGDYKYKSVKVCFYKPEKKVNVEKMTKNELENTKKLVGKKM
jgi:hypothetical protein